MAADWAGKTVLIVDDMEKVRVRIADLFEQAGLKVVGMAENGVEALEKILRLQPDLVSLDIVMPEMDGLECYREIQRRNLDLATGKIDQDKWPKQVRSFILSCLAGEPKIVSHFESEIPGYRFVEKYPSVEHLKSTLGDVFANEALLPPPVKVPA